MNDEQSSYRDPDIETIMTTYKVLSCRLKELQSKSNHYSNRTGSSWYHKDYFSYNTSPLVKTIKATTW